MDFKFHTDSLSGIVVACACAAALVVCLYESLVWGAAVSAIGMVVVWGWRYRVRRNLSDKLEIMLKAVRNGDYAFRFSETGFSRTSSSSINMLMEYYNGLIKEDRRKIYENNFFYEQILANVSTGIVVVEDKDKLYYANKAALRLLDIPMLSHLQQLERYGTDVAEFFRMAVQGEQRQLHLSSQNTDKDLLVRVSAIVIREKNMRIMMMNDVRTVIDKNELEAWIKLSHVLTHEIMNAVTPVVSLSESMMKPDIPAERLHDGLKTIHSTSQGLLSFVDNYRKFTSLPKPCPALFYVCELTDEIRNLKLVPSHVRLTLDVEPRDLLLYADRHLVRQVLVNLVRNAIQAIGGSDGRISVTAAEKGDGCIQMFVSNDGPVINEKDRAHIFVPFFTTKPDGSGIGLSVSRQIMAQHNGSLFLLPAGAKGWNTTFVLEFS